MSQHIQTATMKLPFCSIIINALSDLIWIKDYVEHREHMESWHHKNQTVKPSDQVVIRCWAKIQINTSVSEHIQSKILT